MKKIYVMLVLAFFAFTTSIAQTVLIRPTGDGGFETGTTLASNNWTAVNSTTDSWVLGSAPLSTTAPITPGPSAGTNGAYVTSTPAGAPPTWTYSQTSTIQHLYYDVTIPAGDIKGTLSFKWKVGGEGTTTFDWDNLKVFLAPTTIVTPTANTAVSATYQISGPGAITGMYKLSSAAYNTETFTTTVVPGTTYKLIFSWKSDGSTIANPPAAIDEVSFISSAPTSVSSTTNGGLWSSPATWVGGVVPNIDDVIIADGSTVVVDQVVNIRDLTVGGGTSGILHWNATANAVTITRNLLVNAGANLNMFTAAAAHPGVTVNVGGNLTNNGTIHAAMAAANFNFNNATSVSPSNLDGTGVFVGGIIGQLLNTSSGGLSINTSQNLTTRALVHTAGVLNTNGKLSIDNTATIFGANFNNKIYNVVVTAMGTGYNSATPPTVTIAAPNNGTTATATPVIDNATGTLRSLLITDAGVGYTTNPVVTISGGTGSGATAVAVNNRFSSGLIASSIQKSGIATTTGGINIRSEQSVGAVASSTVLGVGYTSAPQIGFSLPFGYQNLVTAGGSGYTTAPTITVSGGTSLTGVTNPTFTVVVAQGKVVSVIAATGGTFWTSPPTLTVTGGGGTGATVAYPANCLTTATATIANGAINGYTVTNAGFGYTAAPTVSLVGGGPTTAATAFSAVALYNLTLSFFAPAASNVAHTETGVMPANRRINILSSTNAVAGSAFTGNVEIYGAAPLVLTTSLLSFGTNTLFASHPAYAGTTGSLTNNITGNITLSSPGGSVTRTFPYDAPLVVATGTGPVTGSFLTTGSTITSLTASRTAAPTGASSPIGSATGTRGYRLQTTLGAVYGTAPTVTLNYNAADALSMDNSQLFVGQSTSLTGTWTNRSVAGAAGALAATGSRITGTTSPTLIVPTGDDYYAWIGPTPCSGAPAPGNTLATNIAPCAGSTITLSLQNSLLGTPGITYQWLSSADGSAYTPITGATASTYVATVSVLTYYKADVTCAAGPTTTSSTPITITPVICSYNVARSTGATFTSINATGTQFSGGFTSADDANSAATNIGFTFNYKGTAFTQFLVNTNGFIQLGSSNPGATYTNGLVATYPNIIAPLWDDWVTQGNTAATATNFIKYLLSGTAPNRVLTVEWTGMERFNYAGPNINFQAKLYETSSKIEFIYGNMLMFDGTPPTGAATANSYSIGISGPATAIGLDKIMALQTSNSNCFNITDPATLGNGIDCNTMYTFTPGTSYVACTAPAPTAPANDEIAGAIVLPVNASPCTDLCGTYYTSIGATASATPASTCSTAPDDDVWFKFNATSASSTITVRGATGYDVSLALYDNTNTAVAGFTCVNATAVGLTEIINATTLIPGNDYFIRVSHNGAGTGNNNGFSICVNQVILPPSNDDPCGAQSLTVGTGVCTPYEDNPASLPSKTAFIAATNTTLNGVVAPSCTGAGATVQDVWFSFVATDVAQIVTVAPKTGTNAAFQLYSVASGTCAGSNLALTSISCINNGSTGAAETNTFTGLTVGNTYYVRVYAHATGQGGAPVSNSQFSICVNTQPVPNCTTNTAPATLATNTSVTPILSWSAATNALSYDVYIGSGSAAAAILVTNVTTTSYTVAVPLNYNTTYYWYVVPKNNTGSATGCISSAFSFTTLPQCSGAPTGVVATPAAVAGCGTVTQLFTAVTTSTGALITYQWESSPDGTTWTPISGATSLTYNASAVTATTYYHCIITCAGTSSTTSNDCVITIGGAPTVTVSPVNATVCGSGTATFTATASSGATFAWETSADGIAWTPISGAASATYTTPTVSTTTYYHCIVTCGTLNTTSATSSVVIGSVPTNDECAGAETLIHSTDPTVCTTVTGTTACATTSTEGSSTFFSSQDDDVWYSFTATSSIVKINLSNITLANGVIPTQMGLGLHTACATTDVLNAFTNITAGSTSWTVFGLTTGTAYKVRVLTSGTTGRVNFNICLTVPSITAGTPGTCVTGSPVTITAANANFWTPLFDLNSNLIGEINPNGNVLGVVTPSVYTQTGALRTAPQGGAYMNRNIGINVATQPTSPVSVRLYFTDTEKAALDAAVPGTNNRADIVITKEAGGCTPVSNYNGTLLGQTFNAAYGASNHYVELNVSSFSEFFLHKGLQALPVSIEYFNGTKQSNGNILDWKISCTAIPEVTIELQRSSDSRNYKGIYTENATAVRCLQAFVYNDATPAAGINYYRLKLTEPNGAVKYSSIIALINKDKGYEIVSLAPNPARVNATLTVASAKAGKIDIVITDVVGKVISKQQNTLISGNNTIAMNFAQLATGTYNVVITNADGEVKTTRFVKY